MSPAETTPVIDIGTALQRLPVVPTRAQIEALEDAIAASPHCTTEWPTQHFFADGLYARRLIIPAGGLLTGRVHRAEHFNFVQRGLIDVWTEHGMKRLATGAMLVSQPGTKRVGLALQETIWTTVHAVPPGCTTPEAAEALLVEPIRPELAAQLKEKETPCLSSL